MATVRINQSHRDYARNRISESFQKRINALYDKRHKLDLLSAYIDAVGRKQYYEIEALPSNTRDKYIKKSSSIAFTFTFSKNREQPFIHTFTHTFPYPVYITADMDSYYHPRAVTVLEDHPVALEVRKLVEAVELLVKQRDALIDQLVNHVMVERTTLQGVLEVWPSALDFLPDDVRQRHAAPNPKREPRKEIELSDDAKISLITVRLLDT